MATSQAEFFPTSYRAPRPINTEYTTMSIEHPLPPERSHHFDDEVFAAYALPSPPRRSRISFGPTEILSYIETTHELSWDERAERWYRPDEMEQMKRSARTLCQMQAKGHELSADDSIRGMDVYYPSRQRNHKKHVYHVLEAYRFICAKNNDHVAQLSEKWSFKNKERASAQGMKDFYEAYFHHMTQPNIHHQQQYQQLNDAKRRGSGTPIPEPPARRS